MSGAAILAGLLARRPEPTTGGASTDPRPVIDDPIIMAMRPNGRRIATLRVGPARSYTTIQAAVDAASALQIAKRAEEGVTVWTPDYWVDIIVDPGEYGPGPVRAERFQAFYSAGGVKGDTVVMDGSLDTQGNIYWEGIDLIPVTPELYKYPIHHAGPGTSVFARSRLEHLGVGSNGYPTAFGMDGGYGPDTTVIYDCWLGPGGFNAHGSLGSGTYPGPEHFVLANSYMQGGGGFSSWDGGTVGSDEQWIVNSNVNDVGGSAAGGTHLGGTTVRSGSINPAGPVDYSSDWPVPIGCVSAYWRNYWGM